MTERSEVTAPLVTACPSCGEELLDGARFCEACGTSVGPDDGADAVAAGPTVADRAGGCERCGSEVAPDGYCTNCGHRAVEPIVVEDVGSAALATHRGRRHHRNEDAGALAATSEGWPVLVVSDGVSASPNPHLAAAAAVRAAVEQLDGRPFAGPDDLVEAVAVAHRAACEIPAEGDPSWTDDGSSPACTIVVAVAADDAFHVANVGDARGYHVAPSGDGWVATALTTDDSVAAQAVASGIDPVAALELPGGHAITAWLGRDAPPPAPHVRSEPAAPQDVLLVCSDGLWNYAPSDPAMSEVVTSHLAAGAEALGEACEGLVAWANDQGGADNICVAITTRRTTSP